jgi:hypothetical protein
MTEVEDVKKLQIQQMYADPESLIREMLKHEQADTATHHYFGPGIYIREVRLPAGSVVVGEEHKFALMNVLIKGRLSLLNPDGTETEVSGPYIYTSQPGRKIAFVHEEAIWLNIHATEETDIEKIEDHFVIKSQAALEHKKREEITQ